MMDYVIAPVKRDNLRLYSKLFRSICGFSQDEPIDPVYLLDRLPDLEGFSNVRCEIVNDDALPTNVPAACQKNDGEYVIQIKDCVFRSADKDKSGGCRMHIMHEIMHAFLDKLGYTPMYARTLADDGIPCYRQLEWAVKALAGEVMMPYEATKGMSESDIVKKYGVSYDAAHIRLSY